MNEIGKSIHNLSTPFKVRAMNSLEKMFQCDESDAANNQINSITEQWFNCLTETNDLSLIQEFCRNPFPEIKVAAMCLLRSICAYQWGKIALSQTAGLIEYLLDRNAEFDKEILHEKYNVIKSLTESNAFDGITTRQIRQYVKDGIFYVQGVMEVAIDGN